jgi:hypothetical protein
MSTDMDDSKLDPAEGPGIDRRTRTFLRVVNGDDTAFWELPGDQPQRVVTVVPATAPGALRLSIDQPSTEEVH